MNRGDYQLSSLHSNITSSLVKVKSSFLTSNTEELLQLFLLLFLTMCKSSGKRGRPEGLGGGEASRRSGGRGFVVQYVADPLAHTPPSLCTLLTFQTPHSLTPQPGRPCPASRMAFVCPHNLSPQRGQRRWSHPSECSTPPSALLLLLLACSCPSTPAAFILSLFTPWRGDTKRHLAGRDKPILGMPDATRLPPFFLFFSLSLSPTSLPGSQDVLRWGFKHH